MNSTRILSRALAVVVISVLGLSVSGCFISIVDIGNVVPAPLAAEVDVKESPTITDVRASYVVIADQDYGYYDRDCFWIRGRYVCRTYWVWTRTDAVANIRLTINVRDPELDLDNLPSMVRILGTELPSGNITPGRAACLLNIDTRDISLNRTNITGSTNKIVTVDIRNVTYTFERNGCTRFTAELPVHIVVDDQGVEVTSPAPGYGSIAIDR